MTYPRVRTDYGYAKVEIVEREKQDVKVRLKEDFEPIGEKDDTSWVPYSVLIEE